MTGRKYFKSLLVLGGVVSVFSFGKTALADDEVIQPIEQSEGFNLMTEGYALSHVLRASELPSHGVVYRMDKILQMEAVDVDDVGTDIAGGVNKVGAVSDGNDKSLWSGEYAGFFQIFMPRTYR